VERRSAAKEVTVLRRGNLRQSPMPVGPRRPTYGAVRSTERTGGLGDTREPTGMGSLPSAGAKLLIWGSGVRISSGAPPTPLIYKENNQTPSC
jgi:hypothetical protein